jgi:6-pyruvoyltetrahydropterin/6-carboxytetrahydropterin synthase
VFHSQVLDANKFVLDIGKLDFVKEFLADTFDHTLLLNTDDPALDCLSEGLGERQQGFLQAFAKIVVVPNCGMEALAEYVFNEVNKMLGKFMPEDVTGRKLRVCSVTCWEDSKNRSTWSELPAVQYA